MQQQKKTIHPLPIQIPNGEIIESTHTALLNHQDLHFQAIQAHLFAGLRKALLSIGTFWEHGCEATFTSKLVHIKNKQSGKTIMGGTIDTRTNLYMLSLTQRNNLMTEPTTPDEYFAGSAYECRPKKTLVDYHYASWWIPTKSGWGKAITKNFFTSWTGLSVDLVHKHLTKKQSTILGHLQQRRKGLRSTHDNIMHPDPDPYQDQFPQATQSENTNLVFSKTVDLSGKVYTYQTGRFSVTSIRGNKYILVAYNFDSNTIHTELLKTRSGLELTTEYQKLHSLLTNRGLRPHLHILDNECPNVIQKFMREVNENFQLFPPHIHRRNSAEYAIRTFKENFIAGLSSTHKDFPLHIWCRLIPHAILALNLLRQSRMNPKLSGYAQLHGAFNYNATPLAPPGTQVIIHEKPTAIGTWEPHGVKGWYLGPSMNHYRYHHVYTTNKRGERDSDCVEFFPTKLTPSRQDKDWTSQ